MQYNNVLLIHHSTPEPQKRASAFPGTRRRSPFPAGEGRRVNANFIAIQRISFKLNPFKAERNIFI